MLGGQTEPNALISEQLATEDGLTVGATLSMRGIGDRMTYRVIGILAGQGPLADTFGRIVVVPVQTAQAVFGGSTGSSDIPAIGT